MSTPMFLLLAWLAFSLVALHVHEARKPRRVLLPVDFDGSLRRQARRVEEIRNL